MRGSPEPSGAGGRVSLRLFPSVALGTGRDTRPGRGGAGAPPQSATGSTGAAPRRRDEAPDEALLRAVFTTPGPAVRAYARRLTHDRGAAEDVAQETFMRAWRHPEVLTLEPHQVRAWLLTVTRHLVIDRSRAAAARLHEVSDGVPEYHAAADPDHTDRVDTALMVADAVAKLSDEHREIVHAVFYADRSRDEVAASLDLPVGTVKSRTHYALAALRRTLARGEGR